MYKEAVRVATTNNFNCTPAEWSQLGGFAIAFPNSKFFVNCNARTPLLRTIKDHPYPAVITSNPELTVVPSLEKQTLSVPARSTAFVRVKWLPSRPELRALVERLLDAGRRVVITPQRFNSKATLLHFTDKSSYRFECSRFRLQGEALEDLWDTADRLGAQICDRTGQGCQACGLCAKYAGVPGCPVKSLNLSSSGECPYSCPDCYAHTMIAFTKAMGGHPTYDIVAANEKQAGRTAHIHRAKEAACTPQMANASS